MHRLLIAGSLAVTLVFVALGVGCAGSAPATGSFDRTLKVDGPVHLELTGGPGEANISTGSAGEVHIRAEVRVHGLFRESASQRAADLARNPPIEQNGNLIRVGSDSERLRHVEVNYTIVVPVETKVLARSGSGGLHVSDIRGPASLISGSGDVTAQNIGDDLWAKGDSGDIHLAGVKGEARVSTGSGDVQLSNVTGAARLSTGSGDIVLEGAGGPVTIITGSGDVQIKGVRGDLRISTGSGEITVDADPSANYWELHTGSGEVSLHVPPSANFRLHARSRSGEINSSVPIVVEERSARGHGLRGHIGQGGGRIEIETGSGDIQLR